MASKRIQLAEAITAQSTIAVNTIPQVYTHLEIPFRVRASVTSGGPLVNVNINAEASGIYDFQYALYTGTATIDGEISSNHIFFLNNDNAPTNSFAKGIICIENYTSTDKLKICRVECSYYEAIDDLKVQSSAVVLLSSQAAIQSISFTPTSGSFVAGSFFDVRGL